MLRDVDNVTMRLRYCIRYRIQWRVRYALRVLCFRASACERPIFSIGLEVSNPSHGGNMSLTSAQETESGCTHFVYLFALLCNQPRSVACLEWGGCVRERLAEEGGRPEPAQGERGRDRGHLRCYHVQTRRSIGSPATRTP